MKIRFTKINSYFEALRYIYICYVNAYVNMLYVLFYISVIIYTYNVQCNHLLLKTKYELLLFDYKYSLHLWWFSNVINTSTHDIHSFSMQPDNLCKYSIKEE